MPEPTQVAAADSQSVTAQAEPAAQPATTQTTGVDTQPTPGQQPPADVERIKAEYEARLQVSQRDLNNLKSSLQRQQAQQNAEWQKRYEELQKQFKEVRLNGMDETQRKQYEAQMLSEEIQTLQTQLQEANSKTQEIAAIADAKDFFLLKGVPLDRLVLNQGYDALVTSGWDYVTELLDRYQKGTPKDKPPALPEAPPVVTDKSEPVGGVTWGELVKKYGSEERVFQLADQGYIDLNNVKMPPII